MTDKKISPHIERFKTLQDYAQYFIDEKGKTPNVSCVDEPVEVVKFAEQKLHPDYIRTGNDTYNVVVYDDFDYSNKLSTPSSQVCTQSIMYKFVYDSNTGVYAQYDFITAPTPSPSNGIMQILQYIYPSKIFEDFEGTITRSINLDSTTKYNASTKASYKAIHRTLGNKDINIFQISCASETVALNEKIEFPGGYMYYPSPVYTIEGMNDDVVLDDGFLFGGHTAKVIKQDDRHFILALGDTPLPNNKFDLPVIMIPFHYKDLPELTFFKYFSYVNLPALYEERPQAEFEFYLNIYSGAAQKVTANDLVYKQYSPGFNVTYEGKKLYAEYRIGDVDGDNKMLGSVELDGSALEQEMTGYLWETSNLLAGAHELVAYDGEHNEIGRMTFNVKMPEFDYVLYDANKNVIEPDEISRYVIDESNLNNDYLIDIHGIYDGKMYQGVNSSWANDNMYNEEITDWRDYIVLSPKLNNHNLEAYNDGGAAGASELFILKPSWCSSDTRYNIMDENNNIAEICFYYEAFTPYLENGNITVENLNLTYDYFERPYKYYDTDNIYFYHVYGKNQRQQVFLSQLTGNNVFHATYDTNNFWKFRGGNDEHKIGWILNPDVDFPVGDYKVTNAYVQYEGLRLDLWDEITFSVSEPFLTNGNLTVDNLKQLPSYRGVGIYYNVHDDYFYSVDKYGNRTQTSLNDATLNATFDTNIIESFNAYGEYGWRIKSGVEVQSGNYEITNAYLEYNGTRLDLWSSANITVVNQTSYVAKNENDETIDPGQNLSWTYDANGVLTSEPFKFTKHNADDTPADANITQDVNYIIDKDNEGLYDFTLFNVEVTRVNNNEYFVVKYTPKAELQTVRNYRVPWIDFTYNDAFNEKAFYCGPRNYVPQSGPMQIYITDAGVTDDMDKETYSFTSSADKTLTYDNYFTYCDDPNYQGDSVVQTITTSGTGITVEYPYDAWALTGFKLTLQPNASGTITIAYQKSQDTDFVPAARTYNITAPQSTNNDYLDYKALTEGGWGNRKLYGIDNNVDSSNGTYEFAIFDESGANHTFNYTLDVQGNAEIISTTTTDAGDPRGEGLVLIYKIRISGQASLTFSANDTPYVAVRFNA